MSTTTTDERQVLRDRAASGARYEDEVNPGWAARIDRGRLDMESCFDCIVGQLHGPYLDVIDALASEDYLPSCEVDRWAAQHGFCGDPRLPIPRAVQYDILWAAWLAEIDRRVFAPAAVIA